MMRVLLFWGIAVVAHAESAIVVRPHTHLAQARPVQFQEVAEFFDMDAVVVKELGEIKLAEGPLIGERLEFNGSAVSSILRAHKTWRRLSPKPQVTIPSRIIVENIGDQVTEAQIRMELINRWQALCNCRVQIDQLSVPVLGAWQAGNQWRLRLRSEIGRGNFTIPLEIFTPGGETRTLWIKGQVSLFKRAPVAKHQINFGERIQPEDVNFVERDITFARDAIPGPEEIAARKARQTIAAGDIVYASILEKEKALKRGDVVRMAIADGGWEVILSGVAEQDGFVGDVVKIRNLKSNSLILATVTGRGEVKVE